MADPLPVVNPNQAFQNNVVGSTGTPLPQTATVQQAQPQQEAAATQDPSQNQNVVLPSTSNLGPGSTGGDVQALQNYLVQQGYLTADQVAGGEGTYGPKTTAAVAAMQKALGINAGANAGYYGPQTQEALKQKYTQFFQQQQKSGQQAPATGGNQAVTTALQAQSQQTTDPVFGAMAGQLAPIMQSLNQVLNNINNPALTAVSLQQEYNQLAQQYNLPGMQSQLMNMQNIMNGTTDDIREEVSKAGGFATESQVQGMAAARNTLLMKQYNSLATQYQAAQTNVQNMMQYASTDQATQLQRQTATAGIVENLASIESQMMSMGMTMQQNAKQAVQYNVTQMGYKGLAASAQGNPQMLGYYENMLGLAPGTLSDPAAVQQMDTYKDQSLQLQNYKAAIAAYNAGYGGNPPGVPTNNQPVSSDNPGGAPQGDGTYAAQSNLLLDPHSSSTNQSLMQQTGLNFQQFSMLTGNTSIFTRMSQGQKQKLTNSVNDWLQKHSNVDIATFQSQYDNYNKALGQNILRFNNTQTAEGEVLLTLQNLDPSAIKANLGNVSAENVAKVFTGQQVNDPAANEYAFYFGDLQKSLAYFYAAQQGKSSAELSDHEDAANVIKGGLSSGGIKGLTAAVKNTTAKMKVVLGQTIDNQNKNVWNLFGVGDKYQSPSTQTVLVKSPDGTVGNIPASQLTDALNQGYTFGQPVSLPSIPIQ